jgi:hypothetical protein
MGANTPQRGKVAPDHERTFAHGALSLRIAQRRCRVFSKYWGNMHDINQLFAAG